MKTKFDIKIKLNQIIRNKIEEKINQKKLKNKTNSNKKNKSEIFIFYFLKTKLMSNDKIRKK
jgi:hypothetical protein